MSDGELKRLDNELNLALHAAEAAAAEAHSSHRQAQTRLRALGAKPAAERQQ